MRGRPRITGRWTTGLAFRATAPRRRPNPPTRPSTWVSARYALPLSNSYSWYQQVAADHLAESAMPNYAEIRFMDIQFDVAQGIQFEERDGSTVTAYVPFIPWKDSLCLFFISFSYV